MPAGEKFKVASWDFFGAMQVFTRIRQCFSNLNMHTSHLGTSFKWMIVI